MMSIFVQLILFLIALAIICLASMWYTRMLVDKMVFAKHRDLEAITSTGDIPQAWSEHYVRRMIRLRETGKEDQLGRVHRAARKSYLRRLARLSEYVRRTRFVENEETRKHALRSLNRLDREWRTSANEPFPR